VFSTEKAISSDGEFTRKAYQRIGLVSETTAERHWSRVVIKSIKYIDSLPPCDPSKSNQAPSRVRRSGASSIAPQTHRRPPSTAFSRSAEIPACLQNTGIQSIGKLPETEAVWRGSSGEGARGRRQETYRVRFDRVPLATSRQESKSL